MIFQETKKAKVPIWAVVISAAQAQRSLCEISQRDVHIHH